jgi:hypothetical protein
VTRPRALSGAALAVACAAAASCGMKGDPLPPLRPIPGGVSVFPATRDPRGVALSFTIPDANTDGTTPVAVDRVEIYAATTAGTEPVPPPAQLAAQPKNLAAKVTVRRPVPPEDEEQGTAAPTAAAPPAPPTAAAPAEPDLPAPGEPAMVFDALDPATLGPDGVRHYVAVAVSPGRRGRRGPTSAVLNLPFTPLPEPPADLAATNDEQQIHLRWTAAQPGLRFEVLGLDSPPPAPGTVLTDTPIQAAEFGVPVAFGREACFAVRAVDVKGPVTLVGAASPAVCLTPVDRYPPPAPTGFQAVQEGAAVTLSWTAVTAADLGGYIVLRGEGAGENMQPLMRQPVTGTTYRDATVTPGTAYVYSVYAVDTAATPNVSQQSNRQRVTVR